MKKTLSVILALVIVFSCMSAMAYNADEAKTKADTLNTLGLFKGTDKGYELEKPLTRIQALIMLIRLSGAENDALYPEEEPAHPFTDCPTWEGAESYIAYGYANKITSGISETSFAPNSSASLQMYATFVLRALGYTENVWENWESLAKEAGIINDSTERENFKRGDAVIISRAALDAKLYGEEKTLKESLIEKGVTSPFALKIAEAGEGKDINPESPVMDILAKTYSGITDIYPQGLMTLSFEVKDGKYYTEGMETEKEEFSSHLSSFIGADAESISLKEAAVCEPMMSSKAHSVAVIRLNEGADIEAAKKEIRENVNPRKWICVGVDPKNVHVESIGNVILLAMDDSVGDQLVYNFRSLDKSLATPSDNGFMLIDGRYTEADELYNEASAIKFAEKFNSLKEEHFAENKVYYATIPEKSYYLKYKTADFLNHNTISAFLSNALYDWTQIELSDALTINDYYLTDRHWKQENLDRVMKKFSEAMDFSYNHAGYTQTVVENYVGDYKKDIPEIASEKLTYLVSDGIKNATVDNFQNKKVTTVYDEAKLTSAIPYDVFLSGATPLTTIKNPNAGNDRRLIIFRDSYGSSIAPLFVDAYAEVTLVDLRYMGSNLLSQYVNFENAEILVLLSDKIVNTSTILK